MNTMTVMVKLHSFELYGLYFKTKYMIPNFGHKQFKRYELKITLQHNFDRLLTLNIVTYCKHSKDMIAIISQHPHKKHKISKLHITLHFFYISFH